jgi:hypothetical protein
VSASSWAFVRREPGGRDAAGYGRQDARRYELDATLAGLRKPFQERLFFDRARVE